VHSKEHDLDQNRNQEDELVLVVDESDNYLYSAAKADAHAKKLWHRQVYVLITNSQGEILLQKRSPNRQFDPGKWTASVSGHVTHGDSYQDAACREAKEELGLVLADLVYIGKVLSYSQSQGEVCGGPSALYIASAEIDPGSLELQESEVSAVAFFPPAAIYETIRHNAPLCFQSEIISFAQDFISVFEFYWTTAGWQACRPHPAT
jgi:isopentenyl-diphosphate Delta-isomerase